MRVAVRNYGPVLGVHIKGDVDIDVDTQIHNMGGCQNYGPFLVLSVIWRLVFRGPKWGPQFGQPPMYPS